MIHINTFRFRYTSLLLLFVCLNNLQLKGQVNTDSLVTLISETNDNSEKARLYHLLTTETFYQDFDLARAYRKKGEKFAKQSGDHHQIGFSNYLKGAIYYMLGQNDSSLISLEEGIKGFKKSGADTLIAKCLNLKGLILTDLGKYDEAIETFLGIRYIYESLNDTGSLGSVYTNIGVVNSNRGNYREAVENYQLALKYSDDSASVISGYYNIGLVYYYWGMYDMALSNYTIGLKLAESQNNQYWIPGLLDNIGEVLSSQNKYRKAISYHLRAFEEFKAIENTKGQAVSLSRIGDTYFMLNKTDSALYFLRNSQKLLEESLDKKELSNVLFLKTDVFLKRNQLDSAFHSFNYCQTITDQIDDKSGQIKLNYYHGRILLVDNKPEKAIEHLKDALKSAKNTGELTIQKDILSYLHKAYNQLGDFKNAYQCQLEMNVVSDSILNEKISHSLAEMEIKYEAEKSKQEINLLEKDVQLSQTEKAKQRQISIAMLVISVLLLATVMMVVRSYKIKKKSNTLLTSKNQELTDSYTTIENQHLQLTEKNKKIVQSINYAKKIQNAVFPLKSDFEKLFADSFIFFSPKDVVSGDFYWFLDKGNIAYFAIADCTGHGVPGAFMTILGSNYLDRIVNFKSGESPSQILELLHQELLTNLHKSDESTVHDGMDICLFKYDKHKRILEYSGAHNPLVLIRNGDIKEIKGDRFSIGFKYRKKSKEKSLRNHSIPIEKSDVIYAFSDGIGDQFGGPLEKKFSEPKLKDLLLSIHKKPMEEQNDIIEFEVNQWKGEMNQIDDMIILGAKFA